MIAKLWTINDAGQEAKMSALKRLDSIQFLRGVAALLVVVHHALRAFTVKAPESFSFAPISLFDASVWAPLGAVGVDIFFVISGVVMMYVSAPYVAGKKPVSDFLMRRIVRIYPIYLFVTLMVVFLALPSFFYGQSSEVPDALKWERIMTSLLFIPSFNHHGVPHPILGVGWTLFFEMMFYICFAMALLTSRKHLLVACSSYVLIVLLAASLVDRFLMRESAVAVFFSNPISVEFILGCAVARIALSGKVLPLHLAIILLLGSCAALYVVAANEWHLDYRLFGWGFPSALLVYSLISIEWSSIKMKWPRFLTYLGDISYSLYLIHIVLIYTFYFKGLKVLGITGSQVVATELVFLGAIIVSILGAIVLYHFVEQPSLKFLQKSLLNRGANKITAAAT